MKRFFGLALVFCITSSVFGNPVTPVTISEDAQSVEALEASRAQIRNEFYQLEQESWIEYIDRFEDRRLDNSFDVLFYHINVDITVEYEFIRGDVRCLFSASVADLDQIKLNLQDSLTVDSITGNSASWSHTGDTITINLDRAYSIGETAEVRVYYQGAPPIISNTKGLRYETHGAGEPIIASLSTPFLAHYWWPCKDGPGDKPDSVYIDVTIPDTAIHSRPLIAVCNGTLDHISVDGGKRTFHWRERYPIVTFYVNVAISNFVKFQDYYNSGDGEEYPFEFYCFADDLAVSQAGVVRLPDMAAFFSDIYGPYPFRDEKYGLIQLGFYGGIEKQTNTVQGAMTTGWYYVTLHEFAHMWFADMITCESWHHGWLNEGFAVYSEALWIEFDEGEAAFKQDMINNQYYQGGTLYLQDISNPMNIFISIIYSKGAWVLHMLRHVLGDEVFFDCVYQYATDPEFMYDHATTEEFMNKCESVSGVELDWFFQQWIYEEYSPKNEISYHSVPKGDGAKSGFDTYVHVSQIQTTDPQVFTMPVDLGFWYGPEIVIERAWHDAREQDFVFSTPAIPDSVKYDPDNWILDRNYPVDYTLHIVTEGLNEGIIGGSYNDTICVVCSSDEFTIGMVSGSLPNGLSLDLPTGVISGLIDDEEGLYSFTIEAVDDHYPAYLDTKMFSIDIAPAGELPGDANGDGEVNVGDAVFIINYVFKYGPPPPVPNNADANADCLINVGDAVYMIVYIFSGGEPPQTGCVE